MLNDLLNMHEMDQKIMLKEALSQLTPRQQFVAYRRFYQNQTLASIAEEMGLSAGRLFQIEAKVLRLLRNGLKSGRM